MTHFKKYWWAYALGVAALIYVGMNWNKWFGKAVDTTAVQPNGTVRERSCRTVCKDGTILSYDCKGSAPDCAPYGGSQ